MAFKQAFISESVQCPLTRWQWAFQVLLAMKLAQLASSVLTGVYNPDIEMLTRHCRFIICALSFSTMTSCMAVTCFLDADD